MLFCVIHFKTNLSFELTYCCTTTVNPRYKGPGYNGQNLAVYNCESLEMLRHYEGFVVRKLFKIKRNPNINTLL
jgi:hypothetical protein